MAIRRGTYFLGFLVLAGANIALSYLLGGASILTLVLALVASYVWATWSTQRLLDIRPGANAIATLLVLLAVMLVLNVINYFYAGMLAELREFADFVATNGLTAEGAPPVSEATMQYGQTVGVARAVVGIPLSIFTLYLLLKKGSTK
jgi:hypothetical protein